MFIGVEDSYGYEEEEGLPILFGEPRDIGDAIWVVLVLTMVILLHKYKVFYKWCTSIVNKYLDFVKV